MATAAEIKSFIDKLGTLAVAECNRRIAAGQGFVLPSVCIAQSAIETGWGTAGIMVKANAFFGIKAGGSWTGAVYRADTWEVDSGGAYNTTANFRAYASLADSVKDYFDLIGGLSRYSGALSFGSDKSQWKTPKACITAIWAGGYATDTLYVEKIMNTINARNLTSYDAMITGESSDISRTITYDDLTVGTLKVIDSGRAIENDRTTDTTARAMEWDDAIEILSNTTYTLNLKNGSTYTLQLYLARVNSDNATIEGPFRNGDTIEVIKGDKIAFYIKGTLDDYIDSAATINLVSDFPSTDEQYSGVLAYFVKVEKK